MYYIFNNTLKTAIAQAMTQAQGGGFFDFKPHQKCVEVTTIPSSNTDPTPIQDFRTVMILETEFAPEDVDLKANAESLAEYYSEDSRKILAYLAATDAQTAGKTKEQLDQLFT